MGYSLYMLVNVGDLKRTNGTHCSEKTRELRLEEPLSKNSAVSARCARCHFFDVCEVVLHCLGLCTDHSDLSSKEYPET